MKKWFYCVIDNAVEGRIFDVADDNEKVPGWTTRQKAKAEAEGKLRQEPQQVRDSMEPEERVFDAVGGGSMADLQKEELQRQADEKGIKYDKRWGADRLREKIEAYDG